MASWLHRDASVADAFERRAARATSLAEGSTSAAPLQFAAGLYRVQGKVAARLAAGAALTGSLERDLAGFRAALEGIVRYAGASGPPGLRAEVDAFRSDGDERLLDWWRGPRAGRTDYLARALLRPYGETLAATGVTAEPPGGQLTAGACQRC